MKKRRDRILPPAPSLLDSTSNATSTTKKKRKRKKKKKKKQTQQDNSSIVTNEEEADLGTTSSKEEVEESADTSSAFGKELDQSVISLDDSVREQQELPQEAATTQLLASLPSDNNLGDFTIANDEELHTSALFLNQIQPEKTPGKGIKDKLQASSTFFFEQIQAQTSTTFFEQIQPEETPRKGITGELHSSSTFFEQIQPQGSEDGRSIPPPPPFTSDENEALTSETPRTPTTPMTLTVASTITPTTQIITADAATMVTSHLNSPTHEWVPSEGATSQKERPPGDVIKNPLELPFLLRWDHSDNSLTTTTINGSLISAIEATKDPSYFEKTLTFFEEWSKQLDHKKNDDDSQRQKDYASFLQFLQARLESGGQPLGIPLADLKESCTWIDCPTCREDATTAFEQMQSRFEETKKSVVLNPLCLSDPLAHKVDTCIETAFDYVALEEGNHTPTQKLLEEQHESLPVDLDVCLSFTISEPKQKKNAGAGTSKHFFLERFTSKHLDALVEKWLPCGIDQDVMVTTEVVNEANISTDSTRKSTSSYPQAAIFLQNDEFHTMQQKVLENEKDIKMSLDELESIERDMLDEMSKFSSINDSNLQFGAYKWIKDCDNTCKGYMEKILEILRLTTSERSDDLAGLQMKLWTSYCDALNKTFKACDSFYTVVQAMANQRGVIPKIFVNAPLRKEFQTLVEEKVRVWTEVGKIFTNLLTNRVLKEWCTWSVWRNSRSKAPEDQSLDTDCHDLVKELSEWTETIFQYSIPKIQESLMNQTEHLLELLQKIVEPLASEYEMVEKYFSKEQNMFFASLRSNILLAHGVRKQMRLIDQTEVENMSTGVILIWRQMRIMQSRMILPLETQLPLQVRRWMLQDEQKLDDWRLGAPAMSNESWSHHTNCRACPNGGKQRILCVLAGLVYRWLGDRYMEWKAEVAERELLTDFDFADLAAPTYSNGAGQSNSATKGGKSSKRNKKKKIKSVDPLPTSGTENNVQSDKSPAQPKQDEEDSQVKDSDGNDKFKEDAVASSDAVAVVEEIESNSALHSDAADKVVSVTKAANVTTPVVVEAEANPVDPDTDAPTTPTQDNGTRNDIGSEIIEELDVDDYTSFVTVKDEKKILSAKTFLVGRLLELLRDGSEKNGITVIQL